MQAKSLLKSKTFWIATLQAIIGIVVIFQSSYPTLGWLAIGKSVLDVILRLLTTDSVKII